MDDGLPSPTAAELEDERVRDAVALLGLVIAADPRESDLVTRSSGSA